MTCPECGYELEWRTKPKGGTIYQCPYCGTGFAVLGMDIHDSLRLRAEMLSDLDQLMREVEKS